MLKDLYRAVLVLSVFGFLVGSSHQVRADTITTLFSTGVDGAGAPLPDGSIDPHYTVNGGSAFAIGNPASVGWVGNTATSSWISADPTTFAGSGPFTYKTTFDLTGLDPGTAQLSGSWAADNEAAMFLNGTLVAQTQPTSSEPWSFFDVFFVPTGFINGVNTLEFVVPNDQGNGPEGPTGIQVNITGSASAVPEPGSLLLAGAAGLPLIRLLARRRRS